MEHTIEAYITNLGKYTEGELIGEWVEFPISSEQFQDVLKRIGIGQEYEEIFITDYDAEIRGLTRSLGEHENIEGLNYLAYRLAELEPDELSKMEAILRAEIDLREPESVKGLINLSYNLDCYEVLPGVQNEADYGEYLVESMELPEVPKINGVSIFSYLDTEEIGKDAAINEIGEFTNDGYVYDNQGKYTEKWNGRTDSIPDECKLNGKIPKQISKQEEQLLDQAMKEMQLDMSMVKGPVMEP